MNTVALTGRLTKDPDIRYTAGEKSTCVARYSLAVDRTYKKDGQPTADLINCVAFGKNGEFAEKYLKKGTKIAVTGSIQTGSYTNRDGNKVYTTDVIIDRQEFCESRQTSQDKPQEAATAKKDDFMDIPDDATDELPFH